MGVHRIKDIFDIENKKRKDKDFISITKKKKIIVSYNEEIEKRECYYLYLKNNNNVLNLVGATYSDHNRSNYH